MQKRSSGERDAEAEDSDAGSSGDEPMAQRRPRRAGASGRDVRRSGRARNAINYEVRSQRTHVLSSDPDNLSDLGAVELQAARIVPGSVPAAPLVFVCSCSMQCSKVIFGILT